VLDHKAIGADVASIPNAHQHSLEKRRRSHSASESGHWEACSNLRYGARESEINSCVSPHRHFGTAYEFVFLGSSRGQSDEVFITKRV
jgi:hypothetical protein